MLYLIPKRVTGGCSKNLRFNLKVGVIKKHLFLLSDQRYLHVVLNIQSEGSNDLTTWRIVTNMVDCTEKRLWIEII